MEVKRHPLLLSDVNIMQFQRKKALLLCVNIACLTAYSARFWTFAYVISQIFSRSFAPSPARALHWTRWGAHNAPIPQIPSCIDHAYGVWKGLRPLLVPTYHFYRFFKNASVTCLPWLQAVDAHAFSAYRKDHVIWLKLKKLIRNVCDMFRNIKHETTLLWNNFNWKSFVRISKIWNINI